jgi:superfamily II DNA or RNA helicase
VDYWPHQRRGIDTVLAAIARGQHRILLTSPTGGGKTRMMIGLVQHYLALGLRVQLYTNRRWLLEQVSGVMRGAGIRHGIRAAGYGADHDAPFQISSVQTERSRVLVRKKWELFPCDLALIDEAHLQAGPSAVELMNAHVSRGAAVVGVTATPINLGHAYDELIVAGTPSELRACGALVAARYYAPDEPDVRNLGKLNITAAPGEDLSENAQRKLMGAVGDDGEPTERLVQLYGRVLEWFNRLNAARLPSILFAPGVRESIWFAEQFTEAGVPAAHIDGNDIWLDGELLRSTPERREKLLRLSRSGEVVVLCNRFVLREGIDAPWLSYGIGATPFGSLQSCLQSFGRLLRACPGKAEAIIQDHGGNYWRHGSVNEDRVWRLAWSSATVTGEREDRMREKPEEQPVRCPKCTMVSTWRGARCPKCGYELPRSKISRPVVQLDGTLKEITGDVFRPRRMYRDDDAGKLWESMYHRARSGKWDATWRQAEAMFAVENGGRYPDRGLPFMPANPMDWYDKVSKVPRERLIPKP